MNFNTQANSTSDQLLPITILTDPTDGLCVGTAKGDNTHSFRQGPTVSLNETKPQTASTVPATHRQRCTKTLDAPSSVSPSVLETASGNVRFLNESAASAWAHNAPTRKQTANASTPASVTLSENEQTTAKSLYAPRPEGSIQERTSKAFRLYMSQGETALGSKAAHLTRNEDGGFVIPPFLHDQIAERIRALCPMRSLARIQTVNNDATHFLTQDQDRPTATWMRRGGLDAAQVMNPKFRPIPLNVIYVRALASQKRLDDLGDSMEEWLTAHIAQALARCENQAFLRGTGRQQPLGILRCVQGFVDKTPQEEAPSDDEAQSEQAPAQGETLFENRRIESLASREITTDTLLQMVSALETDYLPNASWLMSRSALSALQRLQDNTGHFLWQPSLALGAPSSLFGYPVYVSDDLSAATEENGVPILFGDFKEAYTIVERGSLSLLRDPFTAKPYIEFYTTHAVGGGVVNPEALKGLRIGE